ncbi:unnamed protein product [Boreogadus saida]
MLSLERDVLEVAMLSLRDIRAETLERPINSSHCAFAHKDDVSTFTSTFSKISLGAHGRNSHAAEVNPVHNEKLAQRDKQRVKNLTRELKQKTKDKMEKFTSGDVRDA